MVDELLADLTRAIVDDPSAVEVQRSDDDDQAIVLELRVAEDDYGKVIGRGGRTAYALRTVVKVVAAHHEQRVLVDIVDDED
ncbi:KH domain-containing protein [Patulibacter brassicae]|uniref:RNA-binding protein KhpA n=1 Tax=Patulibacter brassicae TaxID=1705717 RepID=A0ABU4VHP4_9ACTN|nr:KH domain-containing protein [Patulibacter brassicae]MDX8150438.1 KH domain-containing protein [Patulibacter brassicae]